MRHSAKNKSFNKKKKFQRKPMGNPKLYRTRTNANSSLKHVRNTHEQGTAFLYDLPFDMSMIDLRKMFYVPGVLELHLHRIFSTDEMSGYVRFMKHSLAKGAVLANDAEYKDKKIKMRLDGWDNVVDCSDGHEVFVNRVTVHSTFENLRSMFGKYGEVRSIKLYWDVKKPEMEVYICFPDTHSAIQAMVFDGYIYGHTKMKLALLNKDHHSGKTNPGFGQPLRYVQVSDFPADTTANELKKLFKPCKEITFFKLRKNNDKPVAELGIKDCVSLKTALSLNNADFKGSKLCVQLITKKKEKPSVRNGKPSAQDKVANTPLNLRLKEKKKEQLKRRKEEVKKKLLTQNERRRYINTPIVTESFFSEATSSMPNQILQKYKLKRNFMKLEKQEANNEKKAELPPA